METEENGSPEGEKVIRVRGSRTPQLDSSWCGVVKRHGVWIVALANSTSGELWHFGCDLGRGDLVKKGQEMREDVPNGLPGGP